MRGQAHTLEAVIGGLILLAAVGFAMQMTAVTPLSASTSSQHIENQQQATAQGILAAAASEDGLERTMLYWDNRTGNFHGASEVGYYTGAVPNTSFGEMLERSYGDAGVAYNVYLIFPSESGDRIRKRLMYQGVPSDNAVAASRTVVITDRDRLVDADGSRNATTVTEASSYFADDVGDAVFTVVEVEVVAWRV